MNTNPSSVAIVADSTRDSSPPKASRPTQTNLQGAIECCRDDQIVTFAIWKGLRGRSVSVETAKASSNGPVTVANSWPTSMGLGGQHPRRRPAFGEHSRPDPSMCSWQLA